MFIAKENSLPSPFLRARATTTSLLVTGLLLIVGSAQAQAIPEDSANEAWRAGSIRHAEEMRVFAAPAHDPQPTPSLIPKFESDPDPSGRVGSLNISGPAVTAENAFFQDLGRFNQRTCFTCHQPQEGWSVSATGVRRRFEAMQDSDPIFRPVDGATCPKDKVSSLPEKREAYKLLLAKGLIRVFPPMPSNVQFSVTHVDDPYDCTTDPRYGLTSPTTGFVSQYRRPLPTANLGFLTAIMWDGREGPLNDANLRRQALDATLIHAQAKSPPTDQQLDQIVAFEKGLFAAQAFDHEAKDLDGAGAKGGPVEIYRELPDFFPGVNDPLGGNPRNMPFSLEIFDLYKPWTRIEADTPAREAIVRGEILFNETKIKITNVGGLNDKLGKDTIDGSCGICHDTPNIGNHSVIAPLNIGVANAGPNAPPNLDISGLPVFTLHCDHGPLQGRTYRVTDIGRGLISGNCEDIGKFKGPILRGLAARAPYFHNGSAATLLDVVKFYNSRFGIGLTDQQEKDLAAFLATL
jgi:cytochrome c peroxidase